MSYIKKPKIIRDNDPRNKLGMTFDDYEGVMSTLCAGCGHDSITGAIIQTVFDLNIEPYRMIKFSGIGCSSKTPAYFASQSHGFNSVHGRMPSVATGANAANSELLCIGISGDGDTLSIGMGQFSHAIRRNLNMLFIIENNGVYGLTKGQFSASADLGSTAKKGAPNLQTPIDPCTVAISLGASFVARSFSGDKDQLVPLLKAGLMHRGFAMIDVISPCVTFNDHEGSTKSYMSTRETKREAIYADYIAPFSEIEVQYDEGTSVEVDLHEGGKVVLHKADDNFSPLDRGQSIKAINDASDKGELLTGLLYINESQPDFTETENTVIKPLNQIAFEDLCPGSKALHKLLDGYK
jgi:2-oxoglutarate ferredoxin oxidoreductase subunit beta